MGMHNFIYIIHCLFLTACVQLPDQYSSFYHSTPATASALKILSQLNSRAVTNRIITMLTAIDTMMSIRISVDNIMIK